MRFSIFLLFTVFTFAQQTSKVDFIKVTGVVAPDANLKKVIGSAVYHFKVIQPIDTIRSDAKNMNFDKMLLNNKQVKYKSTTKELLLFEGYKSGMNSVSFNYTAFPKQTMYFNKEGIHQQIWTQGQGKYTSHWFPSFDDVNEKVIFNLQVTSQNDFVAISNGVLKSVKPEQNGFKSWFYEMKKPDSMGCCRAWW